MTPDKVAVVGGLTLLKKQKKSGARSVALVLSDIKDIGEARDIEYLVNIGADIL